MPKFSTTLWLDGDECAADITYRIDEVDPIDNFGRLGKTRVVIETVELIPSTRLEQFLIDKIEIDREIRRREASNDALIQWQQDWSHRYG